MGKKNENIYCNLLKNRLFANVLVVLMAKKIKTLEAKAKLYQSGNYQ